MISEAPKSFPLVHHFPSIEAACPRDVPVFGLAVTFGEVVAGLVLVLVVVLAGGFGVVSVVLPPPGCAKVGDTRIEHPTISEQKRRISFRIVLITNT